MELKTTYSIGDTVWIMHNNKPCECEVVYVAVWATECIGKVDNVEQDCYYKLTIKENGDELHDCYYEKRFNKVCLFSTKMDLINSL